MKYIIIFVFIISNKIYCQYALLSNYLKSFTRGDMEQGIIEVVTNQVNLDTIYIYGDKYQPDPLFLDSLLHEIRKNPKLDSLVLMSEIYCDLWKSYYRNWEQEACVNNSKIKYVYRQLLHNFVYTTDWIQIMNKPCNSKELFNLLKCSYFWDIYNINISARKKPRIDTIILDTLLRISKDHFENVSCCVDKRFSIKKMPCTFGPDSSTFYKGFSDFAIIELFNLFQNFIYNEIADRNYGTYAKNSNLYLYVYHVELIRFLSETKSKFDYQKFNKLFTDYPDKILNGGAWSSEYLDKFADDKLLKNYAIALAKKYTDREVWITIPSDVLKRNKVCNIIISNSKNPEAKKRFAQAIDNDNGLFNKEIRNLEQAEKNKEIKLILKNKLKS